MGGSGARAPQLTKSDVYRKLLDKYKEWFSLLVELEKQEKELKREFAKAMDKTKMQNILKNIK